MDSFAIRCLWLPLLSCLLLLWGCSKEEPAVHPNQEQPSEKIQYPFELLSALQTDPEVSLTQATFAMEREGKGQSSLRSFRGKRIRSTKTLYISTGEAGLYVINYEPEGYRIVSASRKYTPIIAHSSKGFIPVEGEVNPVLKALLEDYVKQVEHARSLPDSSTRLARLQWEMLGVDKPDTFRSLDYDEDISRKLSNAIAQYVAEGYRVYRYRDVIGHYDYHTNVKILSGEVPANSNHSDGNEYMLTAETKRAIDKSITINASKAYSVDDHVLILLRETDKINEKGPLLSTTWGQGFYPENDYLLNLYRQKDQYNMFVPNYYPLGCVALATGQIMRYHRHPRRFDWDGMSDHAPNKLTAKFLYEVAKGVSMVFKPDGSESNKEKAKKYLKSCGYSVGDISGDRRTLHWEVNHNRPVYVRGKNSRDQYGHAFVLDGYKETSLRYEVKVMALPDAPWGYLKDENLKCIYSDEVYQGLTSSYHLNLGWDRIGDGYYTEGNFRGFNEWRAYMSVTPIKR